MYIRWSAETVRSSLNSFRKISRPLCKNWYTLFPGNGRNIEANIDYIYCHHSANSKGVQLYKYFFYANKRTWIAKKVKWLGWGNWEKDEERKEVWKKSDVSLIWKPLSPSSTLSELTFFHTNWSSMTWPIPVAESDLYFFILHGLLFTYPFLSKEKKILHNTLCIFFLQILENVLWMIFFFMTFK